MAPELGILGEKAELLLETMRAKQDAFLSQSGFSDANAPWLPLQPELVLQSTWTEGFINSTGHVNDLSDSNLVNTVDATLAALATEGEGQLDSVLLTFQPEELEDSVVSGEEVSPIDDIATRDPIFSEYGGEWPLEWAFGPEWTEESQDGGGHSNQTSPDDPVTVLNINSFGLVEEELGTAFTNDASGTGGREWIDGYTSGDEAIDDSLEYNVKIEFVGDDWTAPLAEDFLAAADYLSAVITDDVDDIELFGETVDDIVVTAALVDIDGPGGILGVAGPEYIRAANGLPITAIMAFDSADAASYDEAGLWDDIVLHEMLHGVGFGTVWGYLGLLDINFAGGDLDARFNGENANKAFSAEYPELDDGLGPVVETDGGRGTAFGHWDESAFDNELMTGYIDLDGNYVSDMTIASLEDLGYETIYDDGIVIA